MLEFWSEEDVIRNFLPIFIEGRITIYFLNRTILLIITQNTSKTLFDSKIE